jgi:hypothetical protein
VEVVAAESADYAETKDEPFQSEEVLEQRYMMVGGDDDDEDEAMYESSADCWEAWAVYCSLVQDPRHLSPYCDVDDPWGS